MQSLLFQVFVVMCLCATLGAQNYEWENYTNHQEARVLLDDSNYLWIGSTGGLLRFDKSNGTATSFSNVALPSNYVQALFKGAANNRLWVGTDKGLSVFDGADWKSAGDSPSPINSVRDIQGDQDGSVWIAGGDSYGPLDPHYFGPTFASLKDGKWMQPELEEFTGFDSPIGFCLDVSPPDGFYCGTNRGLYFVTANSWQKMEIPSSKVFDIAYDERNNCRWLAADNGLYKLKDGTLTKAWGDGYEVRKIEIGGPDRLWLVHQTRGLVKYENESISSPLNVSGRVFDVEFDSDHTMWIGTDKGLTRWKEGQLKSYSFDSGLKSNDIISIASGPDGAVYFTSYVDSKLALGRYDGENWVYYSLTDVSRIHVDSKNRLWAIAHSNAYYNEGTTWTRFTSEGTITCIAENSSGDLWFGGKNHLLYRVNADLQGRKDFGENISMHSSRAIISLLEDEKNNVLWIGFATPGGILQMNLSNFETDSWNFENSALPYSAVQSVRRQPDGTIWAAFGTANMGGLYDFKDDKWTRAPIDDWGTAASYISDLEIDASGRVWFTMYGWNTGGTYGGGLGMYDGVEWRQFRADNSGLANNYATGLALDSQGSLWVSTYGGGISRYSPPPKTTSVYKSRQIAAKSFKLGAAYPNPFNPTTMIPFDLPTDGFVTLKIYDIAGRLVRVLVQEQKLAGAHSILWDGLDDAGQKVAAGVYLYRIEFTDAAGEKTVLTKKMSLVK